MRYPGAEWVPWQGDAYYRGMNRPIAVVLHIQEGWQRTYREWAMRGHHRGSVHFSIGRDGTVLQMLELSDGGYHAGITDAQAMRYPPTWPLWRGLGVNINHYTIGIEHEGFHNELFDGHPFTDAQRDASRRLCRWLADMLEFPYERVRFPAHAEIDIVSRSNDFASPAMREVHYAYMFGEDRMTPEQLARLERLEALIGGFGIDVDGQRLTGEAALRTAYERQWSVFLGIDELRRRYGQLAQRLETLPGDGGAVDRTAIAARLRELADVIEATTGGEQ